MATTRQLNVNGRVYTTDADPEASLLFVLRDHLDLTGTKYGCGEGQCGACTVLIDGKARRSCITRLGDVAQKQITTIEGLAQGDQLASSATGFPGRGRDAMRVLHLWHDYVGGVAVERQGGCYPLPRSRDRWKATSAAVEPTPASWRQYKRQQESCRSPDDEQRSGLSGWTGT